MPLSRIDVGAPPVRRRSPIPTAVIGILAAVVGIAGTIAGLGFGGYLPVWDADLGLDFDVDVAGLEALRDPSAEWVGAFDVTTGEPRWEHDFEVGAEPVGLAGGRLVLRFGDRLVGVDVETGNEVWRHDAGPSAQEIGPTSHGVVLLGRDGALVALDAATGAQRWRAADVGYYAKILVTGGDVAVVVTGDGEVRAVDAAMGALRWTAPLGVDPAGVINGSVVGDLVVVRDLTGAAAFDSASGAVRWRWAAPSSQTSGAVWYSYLEPPIGAGPVVGLQIFDPPTGRPTTSTVFVDVGSGVERWRTPSGALSSFSFDPAAGGGTLFESGQGGGLLARDPTTGTPRYKVQSTSGRMRAAADAVFVTDARVVAIDADTGARRWTRELEADRDAVPVGVTATVVLVAGSRAANP